LELLNAQFRPFELIVVEICLGVQQIEVGWVRTKQGQFDYLSIRFKFIDGKGLIVQGA
jgi:hypothetical protein